MPDREQMTPEALALQMETWQGWTRPRRDAAAAHLRRLAALEREKLDWERGAEIGRERAREALAHLDALEQENTRLREALHVIRITGPEREAGLAREALAGAPDAPEQRPLEYEPMSAEDWKEKADALEAENARLEREADRWVCALDRYREALEVLRSHGSDDPLFSFVNDTAAEALTGAPDEGVNDLDSANLDRPAFPAWPAPDAPRKFGPQPGLGLSDEEWAYYGAPDAPDAQEGGDGT